MTKVAKSYLVQGKNGSVVGQSYLKSQKMEPILSSSGSCKLLVGGTDYQLYLTGSGEVRDNSEVGTHWSQKLSLFQKLIKKVFQSSAIPT